MSKSKIITASVLIFVMLIAFLAANSSKGNSGKSNKAVDKPLYFALGDSVAAGQGLLFDSDSSACYRTNQSYPNLVASDLNYKLQNIACSAASIKNGVQGQQTVNGAILDSQLKQIGTEKPKLITISIGANDVGWTGFIAKCFLLTCGSSADTQEASTNIASFSLLFDDVLKNIKDKIPADGKVIVTGYYRILPKTKKDCSTPLAVSDSGLAWLNVQADNLNTTIKEKVQKYSFAKYASVEFSGHELCTQNPWIQSLTDKSAFHPTAEGQSTIAKSVIQAFGL